MRFLENIRIDQPMLEYFFGKTQFAPVWYYRYVPKFFRPIIVENVRGALQFKFCGIKISILKSMQIGDTFYMVIAREMKRILE